MYDIRIKQPATISITGSTGSGKTTLCSKLLKYKNLLFDKPPKFVILCYSQQQTLYDELLEIGLIDKLIQGYPSYEELSEILLPHKNDGSILIIDDGLNMVNTDMTKIFYELSHHGN